jgi:hypothetical protein
MFARSSAAILLALLASAPSALAEPTAAGKLIQDHADAVVSLQFVLTTRLNFAGQAQDQETNSEVRGVVVSSDGLVLTASSHFDGGLSRRMLRAFGGDIEMDVSVSDLKVLFGNEAKEYEAQIVAKDTNLGIAFVQILGLEGRELHPISLAEEALVTDVGVGQDLLGLTRLARGFDCAPMVGRLHVTAPVERPRRMWAVAGTFDGVGMPVFAPDGRLAGFLSIQEGAEGTADQGGGGMFGGLTQAAQQMALFVLPVKAVRAQVEAARERAADLRAEAAKKAADAAATPKED